LDLHQLVEVQAFLVDINDFGAYNGSQITRRAEPLVPRKTDRRLKVRTAQIFSGDERFLATTADHQLGDLRSAKWIKPDANLARHFVKALRRKHRGARKQECWAK